MNASSHWLDLLDWRRRVAALYERVRALREQNMVPAHTAWVEGRTTLLREHPQSPIPEDGRAVFHRMRAWPYDPAFAFTAPLVPVEPGEEERFDGPLSADGKPVSLVRVGTVELPIGTLDVFWVDDYGGGLFLPFRDATNKRETYGGGRYLLDTAKGADLGSTPDGELVLDFNFAYHPSCAYGGDWACPLAPPANKLKVAVIAGERLR